VRLYSLAQGRKYPWVVKKLNTLVSEPSPLSQRAHAILTVLSGTETGRVVQLEPGEPLSLGRGDNCRIRFDDASVSGLHGKIVGIAGGFYYIDEGSTNGSAINTTRLAAGKATQLNDGDRLQLGSGTLLRFSVVDDNEREALTRMYEAAFRDALTGAYNRKHLDERLDAELAFALRHNTELCVLMLDIDHFKSVNDLHGHQAGDAVLKMAVEVLAKQLRAEDLLARYGGEEFVVITRGIPISSAITLGERLRIALSLSSATIAGAPIRVTTSIGVASLADCGKTRDRASLIKAADQRLYRAKEAGRNRVVGT
jgi:two-component system cell cycle response regulator